MKTYLLIGLVRDPKKDRLFPKPLCTVRAPNLTLAALQLGGHLHDPTEADDPVLSALLWPDMPSAVFHGSVGTGAALAKALSSVDEAAAQGADLDAIRNGSASVLKMFEKIVIGQIPALD